MKIEWKKENTTNVVSWSITIAVSIIFYFLVLNFRFILGYLSNIRYILMPFIVGGSMAYILNFFVKFLEETLVKFENFKNLQKKSLRAISMIIIYTFTIIFMTLLLRYIIPQFYSNVKSFVEKTPDFIEGLVNRIREILENVEINDEFKNILTGKITEFANFSTRFLTDLIPYLANFATRIISLFLNTILAIIISAYILYDKENFSKNAKKVLFAICSPKVANKVFKITKKFDETLKSYLMAKGIGAVVVGVIFYIILLFMRIEYALLFAFILGFTNLIPWFGSYLGAIPIFVVLLFSSIKTAIWFIVIVFIVGLIDGNFISPKLSSKSLGISSFWVIFALVLGGSLFGILGFLLAVPVFVVIYSIIKENVEEKLEKKGIDILEI